MKDLSNENIIHVNKNGIQYIQFRKLLEYKDIISHAYGMGLDRNYRTSRNNGDIVYNNTSLYLADISDIDASSLKGDSETKRLQFFNPDEVPKNLMDADLIKSYLSYTSRKKR